MYNRQVCHSIIEIMLYHLSWSDSMLFSSTTFLFFFLPFAIVIYFTILKNKRKAQNIFLCLISIVFYAWGEPAFVFVMLFSILINYFLGLYIGKKERTNPKSKIALVIAIIINFSILFVFKYLSFTMTNICQLFGLNINIPNIALPIGISFFTFQAMSYVIDVYRGEEYQKNILNVGLYISFFPQLIAGPIVRYETVAHQINNRKESLDDFASGVYRFIIGLGKKVLLANTMAVVADTFFNGEVSNQSVLSAWVGAIAYTFQIFFDFSGYSDMAIGLGRMFGFHFLENFNYPYISTSITEFWRRWHISLGTWFRDYLYFPLGGSRVKSKFRLIFNLFIVWLLTGIWHGANWTFIAWGLLFFVLLVFEKLSGFQKFNKLKLLKYIYTMFFVVLGWVIFRADSIQDAFTYIVTMFGSTGSLVDNAALFYIKENAVCIFISVLASTPILKWFHNRFLHNRIGNVITAICLVGILFVSVVYIVKGTYNPFIYFNF